MKSKSKYKREILEKGKKYSYGPFRFVKVEGKWSIPALNNFSCIQGLSTLTECESAVEDWLSKNALNTSKENRSSVYSTKRAQVISDLKSLARSKGFEITSIEIG